MTWLNGERTIRQEEKRAQCSLRSSLGDQTKHAMWAQDPSFSLNIGRGRNSLVAATLVFSSFREALFVKIQANYHTCVCVHVYLSICLYIYLSISIYFYKIFFFIKYLIKIYFSFVSMFNKFKIVVSHFEYWKSNYFNT